MIELERKIPNKLNTQHPLFIILCLQCLHMVLCIAWKGYGAWRLAIGQPGIGPASSLLAAGVFVLFIVGLILSAQRWPKLYVLLSMSIIAGVLPAIIGAFIHDPSLWPSDAWRLGGAALNIFGFVVSLSGLVAFRRLRQIARSVLG